MSGRRAGTVAVVHPGRGPHPPARNHRQAVPAGSRRLVFTVKSPRSLACLNASAADREGSDGIEKGAEHIRVRFLDVQMSVAIIRSITL